MSTIPCMGGCASRDQCANYYAGLGSKSKEIPSERLCGSVDNPDPVRPVTLNPLMKSEVG